jgi:hypothetical protein
MSGYLFNGKRYEFNRPDPNGPANGDLMETLYAREAVKAAADQRAFQAAKAEWAKKVRAENRAIAKLIGAGVLEDSIEEKA